MGNAKCDLTGREIPIEKGFIVFHDEKQEWLFCSEGSFSNGYILDPIVAIGSQADFIDTMAHLYKKPWFDANDFFDFLHRLKKKNNILGG